MKTRDQRGKWNRNFLRGTEKPSDDVKQAFRVTLEAGFRNGASAKSKSSLRGKTRRGTRLQTKADTRPRNPPPNTLLTARRLPRFPLDKCFIFNNYPFPRGGKALPLCEFACTPSVHRSTGLQTEKRPRRRDSPSGADSSKSAEYYVWFSRIEPSPV